MQCIWPIIDGKFKLNNKAYNMSIELCVLTTKSEVKKKDATSAYIDFNILRMGNYLGQKKYQIYYYQYCE